MRTNSVRAERSAAKLREVEALAHGDWHFDFAGLCPATLSANGIWGRVVALAAGAL